MKEEEGNKELCKQCKTKVFTKLGTNIFGHIVIHKKDCKYLKALLENSVEV